MVDVRGDLRAVALLRMLLGIIVVRHLWPDVRAGITAVERFHVPWCRGFQCRPPVCTSSALDRGGGRRGNGVRAGRPAGHSGRLRSRHLPPVPRHRRLRPQSRFPGLAALRDVVRTCRAESVDSQPPEVPPPPARRTDRCGRSPPTYRGVVVYLTSGITKLANPDWRGGLVLWDRMVRHDHLIPLDGWLRDVLMSRALHHVLSPGCTRQTIRRLRPRCSTATAPFVADSTPASPPPAASRRSSRSSALCSASTGSATADQVDAPPRPDDVSDPRAERAGCSSRHRISDLGGLRGPVAAVVGPGRFDLLPRVVPAADALGERVFARLQRLVHLEEVTDLGDELR